MTGSPEGAVRLRLAIEGATVRRAEVRVQRTTDAARILTGRPVVEALRLVPLLFAVCGLAQGVAAVAAVEAALALPPPEPAQQAARALLVLAETAAQHARHRLIEAPRLIGGEIAAKPAAALQAAANGLPRALYPDGDAFAPGGGRLAPIPEALERLLAALAAAAAEPAPVLDRYPQASHRAGFGGADVGPLPALPAGWYAARLAAGDGFAAAPDLDGRPAYTGALARLHDEPEIRAILYDWGPGLLAHLTARRLELARLSGQAAELIARLAPAAVAAPPGPDAGEGAGVVETARGRLAHWVRIEGGRVAAWRTAAPTEWNFHAQGPLARGLAGVAADDELAVNAGLFIAALDPCVAWSLEVAEG